VPYAPGVSYDSRALAEGIQQAGQSIASGFKEFQMNKAKNASAQGVITGMLQSNPELLQGADEKTLKLLEKFKNGDTGLKDNLMLAGWAATTQSGWEQKQKMQAQQLQIDQMKRAQVQQAVAQRFLSQAQQAQGGATGPLSNAAFKQFTSPMAQDAVAMNQMTGEMPSQSALVQLQNNRETNEARVAAALKASKDDIKERATSSGQKYVVNPATGVFQFVPPTPEQLGKAEGAKAEAETTAKSASALLNDITDSAENARHTMASVDRILELYDKGVTSGFGQPLLTQARAALGRFGLGAEGLGNQQQFEKELNNLVLERGRELMKGGGSVSNYERQSVEKASANPNLSIGGNKQILLVLNNMAKRTVALDELRSKLEDQGISNVEISKAIRKARDTMPIGVDTLADIASKAAASKATSTEVKLPPGWTIKK